MRLGGIMTKKRTDFGLMQNELLIFEKGGQGRRGYSLPQWDVEEVKANDSIPPYLLRGGAMG
jgi:hypothetical protein